VSTPTIPSATQVSIAFPPVGMVYLLRCHDASEDIFTAEGAESAMVGCDVSR
jgi:hypothetical protein